MRQLLLAVAAVVLTVANVCAKPETDTFIMTVLNRQFVFDMEGVTGANSGDFDLIYLSPGRLTTSDGQSGKAKDFLGGDLVEKNDKYEHYSYTVRFNGVGPGAVLDMYFSKNGKTFSVPGLEKAVRPDTGDVIIIASMAQELVDANVTSVDVDWKLSWDRPENVLELVQAQTNTLPPYDYSAACTKTECAVDQLVRLDLTFVSSEDVSSATAKANSLATEIVFALTLQQDEKFGIVMHAEKGGLSGGAIPFFLAVSLLGTVVMLVLCCPVCLVACCCSNCAEMCECECCDCCPCCGDDDPSYAKNRQ